MNDELEAIEDIKVELEEYGSDIVIVSVSNDSYDPYTGPSTTDTETNGKGFVKLIASRELSRQFDSHTYDLAISTYVDFQITKQHKIKYGGQLYNILHVHSKVLKNTTLIYELLIVR